MKDNKKPLWIRTRVGFINDPEPLDPVKAKSAYEIEKEKLIRTPAYAEWLRQLRNRIVCWMK